MKSLYYARIKCLAYDEDSEQSNIAIVPETILGERRSSIKGKLRFGLKATNVEIIPRPISNNIMLSREVIDKLHICEGATLCVKYQNGILSIGPVVGFITSGRTKERMLSGSPNMKIVQTVQAAKAAHVFLYFFTIDDVIWHKHAVDAVFYNETLKNWERRRLPLPDVVYDRGLAGSLNTYGWKRALDIRYQLSQIKGLKKINAQHYFDKWDVHHRLSKYKEMKKYLPETVLYKDDIQTLEYMMDRYPVLYIKACIGSNGRSVMRLTEVEPSKYEYDHYRGKLVRNTVESLSDIPPIADKFMGYRRYIIQQGIDAFTYQGNKVDIRVLVQKDECGIWRITSMPVRIASKNCPVTSTKSGSNVYKFNDAFKNILEFSADEIRTVRRDIHRLIYTTVNLLEKEYGSFGELGIDVAIDKDLNVWFIEANSKPAKDTIIKSGSDYDIEKAFLPPFLYARYISGFN